MIIYSKIKNTDKFLNNILFINLNSIIKKIYKSIKIRDSYKNIIIEKENDKVENYAKSNKFMSQKIKESILKKLKYVYKIKFENNEIIYITSKKTESLIISDALIMFKIIKTLKILFRRGDHYQKVIYFDSAEKKQFPKDDGQTLGAHECNSGLSYLHNDKYNNGLIMIYRREEHYKVLIHELIHSNYVDFHIIEYDNVNGNSLNKHICSNYTILLSEAFTETYATLLNIFFVNIHHKLGKVKLEFMFQNELNYNTYIYSKILDYYKIDDITTIFKSGENRNCSNFFPQKTNVFSYYLLKNVLIHKHNAFANFLYNEENKKSENIKKLETIIFDNLEIINQNRLKTRLSKSKSLKMTYNEIK